MHIHLLQMLSYSNLLSLHHSASNNTFSLRAFPRFLVSRRDFSLNFGSIGVNSSKMSSFDAVSVDSSVCRNHSYGVQSAGIEFDSFDLDRFADVGNQLADAAGDVIRKYFRKSFDILDKEDLSPVTIADQAAEESMVQIIQDKFPSHAIYGEEKGWRCKEEVADYVWVLDPIDGTKSFITGKPLFGTLIALLHEGRPILGIIDQPVLRERWIGLSGRKSTLNGQEISTRNCSQLSKAYLYTTSPHLFNGDAEVAFTRVRSKIHAIMCSRAHTDKLQNTIKELWQSVSMIFASTHPVVKVPLYGCDCYAYALLASGYVDLVIESGLKPYDFLPLIPVIEGAGGVITDWKGNQLHWEASANSPATSFNVVAAGDEKVHQESLDVLQWH